MQPGRQQRGEKTAEKEAGARGSNPDGPCIPSTLRFDASPPRLQCSHSDLDLGIPQTPITQLHAAVTPAVKYFTQCFLYLN